MKAKAAKVGLATAVLMWVLAYGTVHAAEVATVTDTSGTVVKLNTLSVEVPGSGYELGYHGSLLDRMYKDLQAIPLLQEDGSIRFVALSKVRGFTSEGKTTTVTLLSDKALRGRPLPGSRILGGTALGIVTLPLEKVKALSLNAEALGMAEAGKNTLQVAELLESYKLTGVLLLRSGTSVSLQKIALVYEESGSDSSYVPSMQYTRWNLMGDIPVKYGESSLKLSLSNVLFLEVAVGKTGQPQSAVTLHVKTTDGQEIDVTVNSDIYGSFKAIGFVGMTDEGYAHVPLQAVQSLTLAKSTVGKQ